MNIKISNLTLSGNAKLFGTINGEEVSDEMNARLKEELAKSDQPVDLQELIKKAKDN